MNATRSAVLAALLAALTVVPAACGGDSDSSAAMTPVGAQRSPPADFPLPVPDEAIVTSVLDFTGEEGRRVVVSIDMPGATFDGAVDRYEDSLTRAGYDVSVDVTEASRRAVLTGARNGHEALVEVLAVGGSTSMVLSWTE